MDRSNWANPLHSSLTNIFTVSNQTLRGSTSRTSVGILQILSGSFGILVEIIFYIMYGRYYWYLYLTYSIIAQFALGIASCLLLVASGILGLCSQRKVWVVIVNMVFNITSAVVSVIWGVSLGFYTYYVWSYELYYGYPDGILLIILCFLGVTLLSNFLTAVTGASFTCTALCPCDMAEHVVAGENTFRITTYRSHCNDENTALLQQPNNDPLSFTPNTTSSHATIYEGK